MYAMLSALRMRRTRVSAKVNVLVADRDLGVDHVGLRRIL